MVSTLLKLKVLIENNNMKAKINKDTIVFVGKSDNFSVECTVCDERLLMKKSELTGFEIKCTGCESISIVYNDGGIYKLRTRYDANMPDNLEISIV